MMAKYKSARDRSLLCAPKGFVEEANKSFISSNGRKWCRWSGGRKPARKGGVNNALLLPHALELRRGAHCVVCTDVARPLNMAGPRAAAAAAWRVAAPSPAHCNLRPCSRATKGPNSGPILTRALRDGLRTQQQQEQAPETGDACSAAT